MTPYEATEAGTKVGYLVLFSVLPMLIALGLAWKKAPRNKAMVASIVIIPLACIMIILGVCMTSGIIHFRPRAW